MSPRRILVVHDDCDEAAIIVNALVAIGYSVSHARGSLDGLVAVEGEAPALVILSWAMPFIDGQVFLAALHVGLPAPPPVLALVDRAADPVMVRYAGARAILSRPVDPGALAREIELLLEPAHRGHSV